MANFYPRYKPNCRNNLLQHDGAADYGIGQSTGGAWNFGWTVKGVYVGNGGMNSNAGAYTTGTTIIPPGASYVLTQSGTVITGWQELR